jgi:tRNA pseudouridine55 synthase
MHGVVNFLKPPGMTSHDAVAFVRRVAGTKRVGHTGTLDPAAAGVLPICIGQATRLVEYLQAGRKTYIAELSFGYETDTLDATGTVVSEADASHVNLNSLRQSLDAFRGSIQQTPPMYLRHQTRWQETLRTSTDGADESELDIQPRQVEIYRLEVTHFFQSSTRPRAMLRIECGSGTYIRSLVRDIGRALNCGATMTFLVRTQNGAFGINEACTPEEISSQNRLTMIPMFDVFATFVAQTFINDEGVLGLSQGRDFNVCLGSTLPIHYPPCWKKKELPILVKSTDGNLAASPFFHSDTKTLVIASRVACDAVTYKPEKVFFLDRED